jgi:hypothetical protein
MIVRFCPDVYLDAQAEDHRVTAHLNAAQVHVSAAVDTIWADRSKAHMLALL